MRPASDFIYIQLSNSRAAVGISAILLLWTAGSVVYLARTLGNETDKSK